MLTRGLLVAVALSLYAASANALSFALNAIPVGPVISGNGQLEFSKFQFFSPFMTVDSSQVTANILADGIELSGPISSTNGLKNFFVLYEVRALGASIDEASLLLDSQVDADDFGLVFSTKQILGDVHRGRHGAKHGYKKSGHGSDFGHGIDHTFPSDRRTLAFLKTADWEIGDGGDDDDSDSDSDSDHSPFRPGREGAIRLVEGGFDPQRSIRVIDGVTIVAWDGTATWESSTNRYALVPEPGTASLMLLGLCLLALPQRRRH